MKIGIVGARTFPQLQMVEYFINELPDGVIIVSGGASGVDSHAIEMAKRRGLETIEILPDLTGCVEIWQFTQKYYERNQKIVDECNLIVAFLETERGGTWDTCKRARKSGKPLKIIKPMLFFPGKSDEIEPDEEPPEIHKPKGAGPFQLRRVSLGSYALRRKSYIKPDEWVTIVTNKEEHPELLAAKMLPDFIDFFNNNRKFGIIHAFTTPPRSIRNIGKTHVMDVLAQKLSEYFNVPYVECFHPWEKKGRGRFAKHGEIKITESVNGLIGKCIWVLDDISTTNFTLQAAVQSLMSLEIHAHGLAYVYMA